MNTTFLANELLRQTEQMVENRAKESLFSQPHTGYQVDDNNLIIYFNNLNENELSDIQYLSKNNTFKSTMLKANSIIIENSDFLSPLKLHFLKNNHVVNEMIIHVQ